MAFVHMYGYAFRMRVARFIAVSSVIGTSACGLVSGLSGYEDVGGGADSSVNHPITDTGVPAKPLRDAGSGHPDVSAPLDGSDALAPSSDGTVTEDEAGSDASAANDASNVTDSADDFIFPDAPPDGPPPPCGPETCSNCCSNNDCVGGQSVTTCGTGGAACKDCTSMGGACGTNGACMTAVPDAAPPPACTASKCGGCDLFYQKGCCKSDETCGCVLIYVPGSPCQ